MDGNRRWAEAKGLLPWEGHKAGRVKLKEVLAWTQEAGVRVLICYAFSTENWARSPDELNAIQKLVVEALKEEAPELKKADTRLCVIGERRKFSQEIQGAIDEAEKIATAGSHTLVVALSYGGRAEITHAVNELMAKDLEVVTETDISNSLWTKDFPEPELIIRTGGQRRLSNFLLWQSAYSELWFTDVLWPDFSKEDFQKALEFYDTTRRNFGS